MTRTARTIFNYRQGIAIQKAKIAELLKEVKVRRGEIVKAKKKILLLQSK